MTSYAWGLDLRLAIFETRWQDNPTWEGVGSHAVCEFNHRSFSVVEFVALRRRRTSRCATARAYCWRTARITGEKSASSRSLRRWPRGKFALEPRDIVKQALAGQPQEIESEFRVLKIELLELVVRDLKHF